MFARIVVVGALAAAGLGAVAAHPTEATAQLVAAQQARLVATNPSWMTPRYFGVSVDIDGDTAVVGDTIDRSATTFRRTASVWDSGSRLDGDNMSGLNVGLSGSSLIVGAHDAVPGRLYSSVAGAWDVAGAFSTGGPYVAIDGDLAATFARVPSNGDPMVCVYQRGSGGWTEIAQIPCVGTLLAADWVRHVAVSGSTVAIADGSPFDVSQTILLYAVSGGVVSLQQSFTSPNGGKFDTLDLDGDRLVLSAKDGRVQVHRRVTGVWSLEQELTPSVVSSSSSFGAAVAIDGDTVVVGAPRDYTDPDYVGSVFVYRRVGSQWTEQQKLTSPSAVWVDIGGNLNSSMFGSSLAISGSDLIVGTPKEPGPGGASGGAAYVYTLSDTPGGLAVTPGTNVTVTDPTTGVRAVFDNVTTGGTLTIVKTAAPDPAPAGRHLVGDACYDVSFSGTYTGEIELTLPYPTDALDPRAFHHTGGSWADVHTAGDSAARTVTAHTTSLSPFGVFELDPPIVTSSTPASSSLTLAMLGVLGVAGLGWAARRRSLSHAGRKGLFSIIFMVGILATATLSAWAAHPSEASAQLVATQRARLLAPNPAQCGGYVDIDGDTAAVGDAIDGSVTLFSRSGATWGAGSRLKGSTFRFGTTCGLSGSTLVVGSQGIVASLATGEIFPIVAGAADAADSTVVGGTFVAVDGDLAATYQYTEALEIQFLCVYRRTGSNWTKIAQIPCLGYTGPPDWAPKLAVDGTTIVLADGASRGVYAEVTKVFNVDGDTVTLQQTIPSANGSDYEADTVALDGDTLVVSPTDGLVEVYRRSEGTWSREQTLTPSAASADAEFGTAVAVAGDELIVGAPYDATDPDHVGSVFVYRRVGGVWTEQIKVNNPAAPLLDPGGSLLPSRFGWSLAMSGASFIVGAPEELPYDGGEPTGAAYVYTLSDTPGGLAVPTGTNVTVTDPATGVRAVFDNVTTAGTLTIVKTVAPDPAPAGRHLVGDACYDVSFSGTYTGEIELTLPYPTDALDPRAFHHTGGSWADVHIAGDGAARTVTAHTTSLSPFGVFELDPPIVTSSTPASSSLTLAMLGVLGVAGLGWAATRKGAARRG